MTDRISYVRRAMLVRRYHQIFTHETDTVGKHSSGVALFVDMIDPNASKNLIMAALTHDLGELVLGDIPATTKRLLPSDAKTALDNIEDEALRSNGYRYTDLINEYEYKLLKLADYCDGLSYCTEELGRGNKYIIYVGNNYCDYLRTIMKSLDAFIAPWYGEALNVVNAVINRWEQVNER